MPPLLSPRWLIAHVVVLAIGVACILLGFWQLDRLDQRRTENRVHSTRFQERPLPLPQLVSAAGPDLATLEFRRASFTGTYDTSREILLRSQVHQGRAGFDILTPLVPEQGPAVVVNRGWVPLEFDTAPVAAAAPAPGRLTVEGVIRPSAARTSTSPDDGPATVSRVDVSRLSDRLGLELYPVYLEVIGEGRATDLPVPGPWPDFTDAGPHLSYAIQWFSFAAVGVIGYGFLLRRALRRGSGERGSQGLDDLHPRQPG